VTLLRRAGGRGASRTRIRKQDGGPGADILFGKFGKSRSNGWVNETHQPPKLYVGGCTCLEPSSTAIGSGSDWAFAMTTGSAYIEGRPPAGIEVPRHDQLAGLRRCA